LIPSCHPLTITKVSIDIEPDHRLPGFVVQATVKVTGQTGVEMEASTAASVACSTIYDMVKAVQKDMRIDGVRLLEKTGGKSGNYRAEGHEPKERSSKGGVEPLPGESAPLIEAEGRVLAADAAASR
ncbi:hypothetical protein OY671_013002, partial [Metschnikowia pulcherrima]